MRSHVAPVMMVAQGGGVSEQVRVTWQGASSRGGGCSSRGAKSTPAGLERDLETLEKLHACSQEGGRSSFRLSLWSGLGNED